MVDTFDPHEPWDPPEWYIRHFDPEDYDENQFYPLYSPNWMNQRTMQWFDTLYCAEASLVGAWVGHFLKLAELEISY